MQQNSLHSARELPPSVRLALETLLGRTLQDGEAVSISTCPAPEADSHPLTGPEKARAFRQWAKSFPANLPLLSLEAVSRESLYSRD